MLRVSFLFDFCKRQSQISFFAVSGGVRRYYISLNKRYSYLQSNFETQLRLRLSYGKTTFCFHIGSF